MATELSVSQLRKALATSKKEQLIDEIAALFTKFDVVQKHFSLKLKPQTESRILAGYRTRISKALLPKTDWQEPKVSEARQVIREYQKVSQSTTGVIDLMLFYVECGVKFLNEFGDYKESFYESIEGTFEKALKLIHQNGLAREFERRCRKVVLDSNDMGYGFGDAMEDLFDQYFKGERAR